MPYLLAFVAITVCKERRLSVNMKEQPQGSDIVPGATEKCHSWQDNGNTKGGSGYDINKQCSKVLD